MTSIPDSGKIAAQLRQAVGLHQQGMLPEAEAAYLDILRMEPQHFDALHLLGVIAAQRNDPARAVELIQKAVAIDPHQAPPYANLGSAWLALRQYESAIASYDRAILLDPAFADAYFNRGHALRELRQWAASLASYDRVIALRQDFAPAHFYRGNVLRALGRFDEALLSYERATEISPDLAQAHLNHGNVLRDLDRDEEAIRSYDRAIAINATHAEAHFNRGVAQNQLKRVDESLQSYDRAIAIRPDYAEARFNRSLVLLLKGDFSDGWREHEWRWRNQYGSNIREQRTFACPQWQGEETIAGKTVLLHAEQGFGDILQFCRYARLVAERGATVILEAPEPLLGLLGSLAGVSMLVRRGSALPTFDYHCPLMSLPLAFGTTLETIPCEHRYLSADADKVAAWQEKLGAKTRPRIGLMWNGNAIQPNDRHRSCRLADWIPHLPAECQLISLQKQVRDSDRAVMRSHPRIADFSDELGDFSDTAALCECMDLVLCVCTSAAHLGGALGKKTWVLLAYAADWRWLMERSDTPWYPSLTLYRQRTRSDWRAVLERIERDIRADLLSRQIC